MSLGYGYGPRMAGGIKVLSNDPSTIRDLSRTDSSSYQSPRRGVSTDRFVSESRAEHIGHEPPQLSPLPGRAFSPNDDRHQVKVLSHQVEGQERVLPRERVRSRPSHSPLAGATMDNGESMSMPAKEADFPAQPSPERRPIRVWEEQPTPRETSRRVLPVHMPDIVYGPAGSVASESGHSERPAKDDREIELQQDVVEDGVLPPPNHFYSRWLNADFLVPISPSSTRKELSPPRAPTLEFLASNFRTPSEGTRLNSPPLLPTPMQSQSLVRSKPQPHLPQASHPNSSTPRATAPPLDLHLMNFETQSELQPERSDTQVNVSTSGPLMSSDPTITESLLGKAELMPEVMHTDDVLMANPLPLQPSSELAQPVLAKEPGTIELSTHSTHINVSQSTSRSPLLPAEDEHNAPPEGILISPPIQPEPPSCRSPEPEDTCEREPPVLEQTMMDVDEELLSLVEDRPVRAIAAMPKVQIESRLPSLTTVCQGTGAGAEQGLSEATDIPSLARSFQPAPKCPPLTTDEEKDRTSIPPPAARNKKVEKAKTTLAAGTATGSRKKKDGTSKVRISHFITRPTSPEVAFSDQATAKPKQPPKPRAKPVLKSKGRLNVVDTSSKGSIPKGALSVNERSRSTSVIPVAVDDVVPEPEADESDKEDGKLYCVCKTRYDEDRMMIACDR